MSCQFVYINIYSSSQALNVVECRELRNIFLLLRQELRDEDIPHRTALRERIGVVFEEHLQQLERDMKVSYLSYAMNLTYTVTEVCGENLDHHRHLDGSEPGSVSGSHSALDSDGDEADASWDAGHPRASHRPYRFPPCSHASHWRALSAGSCLCIRSYCNSAEGKYPSCTLDHSMLTNPEHVDWLDYDGQCLE